MMFVYSDGGPDHRLTYLSVQLSLISVFLKFNHDFLCAARTAPCYSWQNPAERIMAIVNLGLQCVGLMRGEMSSEHEIAVSRCNNLSQLRQLGEKKPEVVPAILDSVEPVKILLSDIFQYTILYTNIYNTFHIVTLVY